MLVVLDAGVFVSAAITPGGVASQVVLAGIEGRFTYLLCPHLVHEVTEVLARPRMNQRVSAESARRFLADVVAASCEVDDPTDVAAVSRDPDDDYLVALAGGHSADLLVTGDADLLELVAPAVPVISVREFFERVASQEPRPRPPE